MPLRLPLLLLYVTTFTLPLPPPHNQPPAPPLPVLRTHRYKESKVGLRWRTQAEVVSGKGQFSCGAKGCDSSSGLAAYEVNFAYQEAGQAKQALVKLCLCEDCAVKLNYRRERGQQYKRLGGMGVGMAGERQREERGGRDRDRRDRERAGKRQLEDGGLDLREAQWREKRHKESYSGREGAGELLPPPPQQQQQRDGRRQQHSGCGSPGRRERQLAEHLARPAELQPQRECREPRSLDGGGDVGGGGSRVQEHQRASSSREGGREGRSKAPGESDRRDDGGGRRAGSSRSQGRVEQQQQQGAADSRLPLPPLKNSSSRAESELQLQRAPVGSAAGAGGGGGDVSGGASSRGVSKTQSVSDDRWQLDGDGGGGGCTAAEAALAEGDGVGDTGVGDTCRWELEDGELNEVDIERWLDSLFTVAPGV